MTGGSRLLAEEIVMLPLLKGATRMATMRARTGALGAAVRAVVLLFARYSKSGQSGGIWARPA
jgi:hypothetical protein